MMARGHIRKRGEGYAVVVELPRDPLTKRRRQRWHTARTKREAEALLTRVLRELDTGLAVEPTRETVGEYVAAWVAKRLAAGQIRESTAEDYGYSINRHIRPLLGGLPLATVTPAHIDAWLVRLRAAGLGERRVLGIYCLVHGALDAAVKLRVLAVNPCDAVETPRPADPPRTVWDEAQARRFRRWIAGDRHEALFLLVLGAGLRKGEVLGLRWPDVDLGRGTLTVTRQQTYTVARKTDYGPPKTKAGARTLRLPSWVVTALTREHARRPDEGACFRDRHGRALTLKQLEYHWHKLVRAFPPDLPAITFHDLRHVNATMALAAGVGPNTLKQRLGHSSIRMTLDRYGHITDMLDADAADQIGGIFESDD